jgi:hypothetical protein
MSEERKNILGGDVSDTSRNFLEELNDANKTYNSIHTGIQKRKLEPDSTTHNYISIDCSSKKASEWTANRINNILPDYHITAITIRNESIMHNYYAKHVIKLEDILEGNLVYKLKEIVDTPLDEKLYEAWLILIHYDYPWN